MAWRISIFGRRFLEFLLGWPVRIWRLVKWMFWFDYPRGKHKILRWLSGVALLALDLIPLTLLYETLLGALKKNTRLLNPQELETAKAVFGDRLPLHLITLDDQFWLVRRYKAKAFVGFHTIYYDKKLSASLLIHELVHYWQYCRYGSVYISEAIWAQRWGGGYNYGGIGLLTQHSKGRGLAAFNFEQQADIIEDYYRLTSEMPLQWATKVSGLRQVFESYVNEVKDI